MSEENKNDVGNEKKVENQPKQKDDSLPLQEKNENQDGEKNPVPYERFKQVNDKMRDLETQLKDLSDSKNKLEREQEEERKKKLKEQEKFKELADEFENKFVEMEPKYKQATERIEKLEGVLTKMAEAQIEAVPELYREVVGSMPLLERISWLAENQSKLSETNPKGIPPTPKPKGQGELSHEQRLKLAKRTF